MTTPGLRERKKARTRQRSEEHTSELQSQSNLVCRLLLEKKKKTDKDSIQNDGGFLAGREDYLHDMILYHYADNSGFSRSCSHGINTQCSRYAHHDVV